MRRKPVRRSGDRGMSAPRSFVDSLTPGPAGPASPDAPPWKILIADDEHGVHMVTELTLSSAIVHGRPLQFLHAYSGRQAVEILARHRDIALVLLDVVMESEDAGLQALRQIRGAQHNDHTRIVIRTGHTDPALRKEAVRDYDVSDFKDKTELTATKMLALVQAGLAQYLEMQRASA
jgi:CheY-like chemotaxis protein